MNVSDGPISAKRQLDCNQTCLVHAIHWRDYIYRLPMLWAKPKFALYLHINKVQ